MAKSNEELKSKMASNALVSGKETPKSFPAMMQASTEQFAIALKGSGEDANRFARVCLTLVRTNKDLARIALTNPQSVIAACMDMAALGLDPSIVNEAYLIPYGNEAKFQSGYKGLMKLARRAAQQTGNALKVFRADVVREHDTYRRSSGFGVDVIHEYPAFGQDRGKPIGYYALYETELGGRGFTEMTVDEVESHKQRFCKSPMLKKPENAIAYGLKTVVRKIVTKEMDMSTKISSAIVNDIDDDEQETFGAVKIQPRFDDVEIDALESSANGEPDDGKEKIREEEIG